jgi:hypothetical protein
MFKQEQEEFEIPELAEYMQALKSTEVLQRSDPQTKY